MTIAVELDVNTSKQTNVTNTVIMWQHYFVISGCLLGKIVDWKTKKAEDKKLVYHKKIITILSLR